MSCSAGMLPREGLAAADREPATRSATSNGRTRLNGTARKPSRRSLSGLGSTTRRMPACTGPRATSRLQRCASVFFSRVTDFGRSRARDTLFPLTKVQTLELCKPHHLSSKMTLTQMQGNGLDSRWTQRLQGVAIVMTTAIEHTCETQLSSLNIHADLLMHSGGATEWASPPVPDHQRLLLRYLLPDPGCNHALTTRRDLTKLPRRCCRCFLWLYAAATAALALMDDFYKCSVSVDDGSELSTSVPSLADIDMKVVQLPVRSIAH
jgi:hypothetical protein